MRAPTIESRELEEELKVALNFLRNTITSTTKPTPQVIVILDSKEEVEILPQFVVEEQTKQVFCIKTYGRRGVATRCCRRTDVASLCTKTCGRKGIVTTCEQG